MECIGYNQKNSFQRRSWWAFAAFLLLFTFVYLPIAHAATITWGGGGATNNWTECTNWVGGVCPSSGDSVVFNTTSTKDSIIPSTATSTYANITVSSGYTGTITDQLSTLTISGSFSQAAGTFTVGTNTLVLSGSGGSFTLSAGTYNVGLGTTSFAGTATISGGTYTASSTSAANFNNAVNAGTSSLSCSGVFPGVIYVAMLGSGVQTFTDGAGCTINIASTTNTNATVVANGTVNFGSTIDTGGLSIGSAGTVTTATTSLTFSDGTNASNFTEASGATFNASGDTLNFTSNGNASQSTFSCTGTFPGLVNIALSGGGVTGFTLGSGCTINTIGTISSTASTTAMGTINFGSSVTLGGLGIGSAGTVTTTGTLITLNQTTNITNFNEASGATFNASGVTINFNSSSNASPASFTCTGTFSGIVAIAMLGTGVQTFTLGPGCTINTPSTTNTFAVITDNGTINFGSAVTVGGLSITGTGTVTTTATTMNIANSSNNTSSFSEVSGSTFNASGVTLNFNSSGNADPNTFSCVGTFPGLVDIAISGSGVPTFTLASGCTITSSATANTTAALTINGTLDLNGFPLSTTHSFTIGSTGTLGLEGNETITAPTLNASSTVQYYGSGTYTSLKAGSTYQNISFTGTGSWATSTNLIVNLGFNQTAGTFTHTGTLTFAGTTAPSVATTTSGSVLNNVVVNTGSQTLALVGSGLSLAGNLTLTSGTLDASTKGCSNASCPITLAGNWVGGNNLFTPRTGTVTLNGTNQQVTGTSTFYALTKTVSAADTLKFGANQTQTITNAWTAQGAASNLLSLRSTTNGTQWSIDPQSTRTLSYLNVEDSDNIDASPIAASGLNITDGTNNTNWVFVIAPTVTTSAATSISTSAATLNGAISATGGVDATQSGFAYGLDSALAAPIATSTLGVQTGTASFLQALSGLTASTVYYFRAYATNTAGTGYGSILSFTESTPTPVVTTSVKSSGGGLIVDSSNIAPSSASFNYPKPQQEIVYPNGQVVYLGIGTTTTATIATSTLNLMHNRQLYQTATDILLLQQFLNTHGFIIATSGPGSPGKETDYFGIKTYQALKKYQKSKGIPSTGYLGVLTRTAIAGE